MRWNMTALVAGDTVAGPPYVVTDPAARDRMAGKPATPSPPYPGTDLEDIVLPDVLSFDVKVILQSQVDSGDAIAQWSRNLNTLAAQSAAEDQSLRSGLQQAAPTADQLNAVFSDVRESLPQTLANLEIVIDMLKRYNKNVEQVLVALAHLNATLTGGMHEALVHEQERSGAAWTLEWLILPQMVMATAASLGTAGTLLGQVIRIGRE